MNRITKAIFTVLVPVILAAQNPTPLIGSLRDGFEYQGGGLLDVKDNPYYAIDCYYKKGTTRLVFQIETLRRKEGPPLWRSLDQIDIPTTKNEFVVYGAGECSLNNNVDPEIICLTIIGDTEYLRIKRAWRANRKSMKFEEISIKGLKCLNPGYGV